MKHSPQVPRSGKAADALLRAIDLALVAAAAPVALPLALAGLAVGGRVARQPALGLEGRCFGRLSMRLPEGGAASFLQRLGAADAPALWNVLRGEMAWVGPRPRSTGLPGGTPVRPGLIDPGFVRRRTAVDFDDEEVVEARYVAMRGPAHDLGVLARALMVALLPRRAKAAPGSVQVADVTFDNVSMTQALDRIESLLDDGRGPHQVAFVNPACVNIAAGRRAYRRVLHRAALVLPDGIGIKIAADMLGTPLRQNVNGTDLFPRLAERLQARCARLYLLGGKPGVAEAVAAEVAARWPGLQVVGCEHGYFSAEREGEVISRIRAARPDVLLVARGVPDQELLIDRHLPMLGVKVALGVGGLFDFVAGRIPRAPLWMRESGLEWVWRLLQEPGRMWRRYLIGNFSFMGRVLAQRLGWRRPAADLGSEGAVTRAAEQPAALRAVLFATPRASSDLPVGEDFPAALLPVGSGTAIERALEHLAAAGVGEALIVASDRPEALRAVVGHGERWGVRVSWHLVRDPAHPYGALDLPWVRAGGRVLIGHADRATPRALVQALREHNAVALQLTGDDGPLWSGWASVDARTLGRIGDLHGFEALGRMLASRSGSRVVAAELATCRLDADGLLAAQRLQLDDPQGEATPASWIRTPWGACSPDARIDPGARMTGPVLVGSGCWIEAGASVGPGCVLTRDVIVSAGTQVEGSVVLPGTYLGGGLELSGTIVGGSRVRHHRWGVETALNPADALVLPLYDDSEVRLPWAGRIAAAVLWLVASPWLAVHRAACRVGLARPAWSLRSVVSGRGMDGASPAMTRLRCEAPGLGRAGRITARLAALADVAAGQRAWLGSRPREADCWYALNPDWQAVLARQPVGLFHAPGWSAEPGTRAEAQAAADVYLAVRRRQATLAGTPRGWGLARAIKSV